jgi:uncharacterized protein (DUF4415 family)
MRAQYDFSKAKKAKDVPAFTRAQADNAGKERITIRIDKDLLTWFKTQVRGGGNYQTLINEALRAYVQDRDGVLERTIRRVLREELNKAA